MRCVVGVRTYMKGQHLFSCHLLFDHFDVHEVVSVIANSYAKVHGHSVVLS